MNRRALLLALPLAIGVARGAERLTVAEAARRAVARNPGLQAADAQVDRARQGHKEVRSVHYPRLDAGSTFTRGDGPVYAFASLLDQETFGPSNMQNLTDPGYVSNFRSYLRVGVPIFTGFELQSQEQTAGFGLAQAEAQSRGARESVRLSVLDLALRHLHARALSDALTDRIAASEDEVASAQRLRAKGLVLGSDYFAAEALLMGLRAWRVQTSKTVLAAKESLAILLGVDPASFDVVGRLGPGGPPLPSENELLTLALAQRPDLRSADLDVQMAGASLGKEKSTLYPRLDAMAQAETNTEDFSSNPSNRLLMVRAAWAIGDPSYGARREKAQAGEQAGRRRREALEEQAKLEILQAVRQYEGAQEALPLMDATADRARKSLEMFRPLYREGRQSILEVLRAEESLARAEAQRLETLAQLHQARARAIAAAGALDEGALNALSAALEEKP